MAFLVNAATKILSIFYANNCGKEGNTKTVISL